MIGERTMSLRIIIQGIALVVALACIGIFMLHPIDLKAEV
jgi:hypothetical protein